MKKYLRLVFRNNLTRSLTSSYSEMYTLLFHKKRIASINLADLIRTNYEAARGVFVGFVGNPSAEDKELMVCTKTVVGSDIFHRNFVIAQTFVDRLGFSLLLVTQGEETMKVMLSPGPDITQYLVSKSLSKKYPQVEELYAKIR